MHKAAFLSPSRKIKIVSVILLLFALLAAPTPRASLAACACCAEKGEWYEGAEEIDDDELKELRRLRFGATANTYLNAAGFETVKGLPGEYETFNLTGFSIKLRRTMTLTLKGERGETGSLMLLLPKTVTSFGADLRDGEGPDPVLYKEWRFEGIAGGSGAFKQGIARGTKFHLILQGRGNMCTSAEDFKNWRLNITGPRASFTFYGDLRDPEPQPTASIVRY